MRKFMKKVEAAAAEYFRYVPMSEQIRDELAETRKMALNYEFHLHMLKAKANALESWQGLHPQEQLSAPQP
jgi:hypothetical protein